MTKKLLLGIAALVGIALIGATSWVYLDHGAYGLNVILRRGGSYWITMKADDARLSPAMREALKQPVPAASAATPQWRTLEPGFEAGEMPVIADGKEVDRFLLARIDPAKVRFTVRNQAAGTRGIDEWEAALPQTLMIVNASYYGHKGEPDTPIISDGVAAGPSAYDARAGAFVASDGAAHIVNLASTDWREAFKGARNAMVAYPLLIGEDGKSHVQTQSNWLANRTFVAETKDGHILIGTTREAFFSLQRLGEFLTTAPLDIRIALNLDGGPIACQSIRLGGFHRKFYAKWEAQVHGEEVSLLAWPFASRTWAMPMVLTVERR